MSQNHHTILRRRLVLAAVGLVLGAMGARAGDLDAPAAPSSPDSALYTLEDLYKRLDDGTEGSKRTGPFAEPASGPTAGTMHTLDDIMVKMPAVDDTDGASAADVAKDKTFWGLTSGGWGPQTGTYEKQCNCDSGTIWNADDGGTRWCVNGDGTVTDLLGADINSNGKIKGRCLVWLQNAGWGGAKPWRADSGYDDAHTRAGILADGTTGAGLTDGSVVGEWRLPTLSELQALTKDPEPISTTQSGPFSLSGVLSGFVWSSTSLAADFSRARFLLLNDGDAPTIDKSVVDDYYVWPVRGGQ